jgi:hypothetical protein
MAFESPDVEVLLVHDLLTGWHPGKVGVRRDYGLPMSSRTTLVLVLALAAEAVSTAAAIIAVRCAWILPFPSPASPSEDLVCMYAAVNLAARDPGGLGSFAGLQSLQPDLGKDPESKSLVFPQM